VPYAEPGEPEPRPALGAQPLPAVGAAELSAWLATEPGELVQPARGRILKLRLGVNPNSSSVGTNVVVFMWSLASSAAVLSVAAALLATRFAAARDKASKLTTPGSELVDDTGEEGS